MRGQNFCFSIVQSAKDHEPKWLNWLVSRLACALAKKLRPASVTAENDKKEMPIIFFIGRWRMGALKKVCLVLSAMGLLLGCGARLQQTTQIECRDSDGQILYAGQYLEEHLSEYLVQVDESTQAIVPKDACRKV
jgi:hypothetical protein